MSGDTDVRLDRNRIAELEPSEGDERELIMLSPFSVPRGMVASALPGGLTSLRFEYSGLEAEGTAELLNDREEPAVKIVMTKEGQKIFRLQFARPITPAELATLGTRLENAVGQIENANAAKRLSYRMIAQIIRTFQIPAFAVR